ncbi:hypothetical protein Tco_1490317, partial [Tanacetum coccineum]
AGDLITSLAVVDPLRKECYELPPFPLRFDKLMRRESCGLGFDTDTNTWKMVCVLLKEYAPPYKPDLVKKLKIYAQWCMYLAQTHGEKYPKSRLMQYQGKPYLLMAVCIGWPVILTSKPEMVEDKSSGLR